MRVANAALAPYARHVYSFCYNRASFRANARIVVAGVGDPGPPETSAFHFSANSDR